MILRKPYAFIIRHFKLIHLFILLPFIYYISYFFNLYRLFAQLQKSSTYVYSGALNYIDEGVIPILLFGLFFTLLMYFTFKEKKKPNQLYFWIIVYFIGVFIISRVTNSVCSKMIESPVSSEWIMICKELNLIMFLPSALLSVIVFLRAIGFNIKKFNFSKDIAELKIADEDSAEFEVLIGKNNYKYMRFLRKSKREIGYYIKENKIAMMVIGGIIGIVLLIVGFYYYNAYLKRIQASESTIVDFIGYTINNSYMTSRNFNGEQVRDGYKFVVIDLTLYNSYSKPKSVNMEKISLADGDLIYYPTNVYNGSFYDLGLPYTRNQKIASGEKKDVILAFMMSDTTTTTDYTFRVQYNLGGTGVNVIGEYKKFKVKVRKLDSDIERYNVNMNEFINTDPAGHNSFSLNIKGYKLKDTYSGSFVKCESKDVCTINQEVVSTVDVVNNTMLIVDYEGIIGKNNNFVKQFNSYNKIFENYAYVEYEVFNTSYREKVDVIPNSNIPGKVFISVPRRLLKADKIHLTFYFRNNEYVVILK